MAKTAMREDQEVEAVVAPDFEWAIRVMKSDIKPAEESNAETRGDLSAAWKIVEDECHVHKGAAKVFRKQCLEASEDKKDDFLRSLYGLMKAAGIGISRDLVDQAEGHTQTMPVEGDEQAKRDAEFEAAAPEKKATAKTPPKLVAVGGAAAPLSNDFEEVLN